MNKEILLDRIKQIDQEMQTYKANYAKLEGHLAEATHWLSTFDEAPSMDTSEEKIESEESKECENQEEEKMEDAHGI